MGVHGMEKRGRAVQQRNERKSQRSMLVGLAAKLRRQTPLQEFKRRHIFRAREGGGPIFRDETEVVGMGSEEVKSALANLSGSARGFNGREKISARAAPQKGHQIAVVRNTLIESRSGGPGGPGNSAHGQGMLSPLAPQAVCGVENAAFQSSVGFARHAPVLSLSLRAELYPLHR